MKLAQDTSDRRMTLLHCPVCSSSLFYPSDRSRASRDSWRVTMVCPDCFAWGNMTVGRSDLAELFHRRQEGMEQVSRQLEELERRHMSEECEKFIEALHGDHIVPEDF